MAAEKKIRRYAVLIGTFEKQIEELKSQISSLELAYRQAGHEVQMHVSDDLAQIKEAREEASRITKFLHGTELFGRYAQDADHHLKIANGWRLGAVGVLTVAPVTAACLATLTNMGAATLAMIMAPILVLFIYASLEAYNHRRREFDRRRIALRVSAIEAFTQQRREEDRRQSRRKAETLLNEFVRKHFIQPDLDSNDLTYLGPRFSLVTVLERKTRRAARGDKSMDSK